MPFYGFVLQSIIKYTYNIIILYELWRTFLRRFSIRPVGLFPSLCRRAWYVVDHFVVLYFVSKRLYASPHCSSPFRLVSPLYFQLTLLRKFILKQVIRRHPYMFVVAFYLCLFSLCVGLAKLMLLFHLWRMCKQHNGQI